MTVDGGAVGGYVPHVAASRAEELQALLEAQEPARFVDEAIEDVEGIEETGKYVTPAYRFALEKLKTNLSMLNPYRDAVQTAIQVVLERETEELERQQERQTKVLEAEEAEIQLHMSNKEKAMEAKREDEQRRAKEVRRIENVFAGEMTKLKQEANAYNAEVNYDIEEFQIKMDAERQKLRREANAEIDDLIAEFESWKTEQLLKLQSQQSEIWESSAEAKEELATELDKLRNKIDHYEAEVARVTGDLGAAEREVHLAEMEMDSAREAAEESIRLADVASAAFRPQEVRLREVQTQHSGERSEKEANWRAKEAVIEDERTRRAAESQAALDGLSTEHEDIIRQRKEEMEKLEERAAKELEIRARDLEASQARVAEARGAAAAAREMLALKHADLKAEQAKALEAKRALDEQLAADAELSVDTFVKRRTEAETSYLQAAEGVKETEDATRRTIGDRRVAHISAAKEDAERARNGLDQEQRQLLSKMKAVYEEVGYARAEVSDNQDFVNEITERHKSAMQAAAWKAAETDREAKERVEAMQRAHSQAAAAADREADLVKDGTRARERADNVAEEDAAIREEDAETGRHCSTRTTQLLASSDNSAVEEDAAAERTLDAATGSVASAEGELDSLLQQMGPRGRLLQSGVGMADVYSAMLQRIEKRLMADRRVVGIMVEAEEAERSKHEEETKSTLAARETAFQESIANSRAELAAEEAAATALQDSLHAFLGVQNSITEAKLRAWRDQLGAVRARIAVEDAKLAEAVAEGAAVQEEVDKELKEVEAEEANGAAVEHIPGVTLSLEMRREAAQLREQQVGLRLALLRSSCSAEGALRHEEAELTGRIAEVEAEAERSAQRLEGQKRRAMQVLEAKRAAHQALETMLNEQLVEEKRFAEEAIVARNERVAALKSRLENGWNSAQLSLSELIATGKPLVLSLQESGKQYSEEDDTKLRDLLRRLTSAKMSLDLVGLDHVERDYRCLFKQRSGWEELEHEVMKMQSKTRARADRVELLRKADVAAAVDKRRVQELYDAATRQAEAVQAEEGRRVAASAAVRSAAEAAEAETAKRAETGQEAIIAARERLEKALREAAAYEAEMEGLMERYADVVAQLDERLRAAEALGQSEMDEVTAQASELAETRAAAMATIDDDEAAWAERTDDSGAYKARRLEEIGAELATVKAQVEEMEQVVVKADEAADALEATEYEAVKIRESESVEAQSHYKAKVAELQASINELIGKPKDDYDAAMALLEEEMARRREEIETEREEFEEICKLYTEEETRLQSEIDELSAEATSVLDKANIHRQNMSRAEERLNAAKAELEAQNRRVASSLVDTKRTLNVYERDAVKAAEEIEAIDADVAAEVELLQRTTDERIASREKEALQLRSEKTAQLEERLAALERQAFEFEASKQTFLEQELERIKDGEQMAEEHMTEALEKVAALAAERQEARQEALKREEENRARQRDKEVEKEQEEAVRYEEEMMMLLDDLETLFAGLRKAEAMHKQALEEEQIRERERVEHATKAELDVELRRKQEEARLMFEKEKARMRREADGLAAEAEAELKAEEEEAIAALRARRRERLKVVDEKRAEVRAKLEKTWVESQVRLREEHIEEEHMKLSLVSKAFGLFGRKQRPSSAQKLRDAVHGASQDGDEEEEAKAWEERKKMERELAQLEAEMSALEAVADL